jgi:tetratricopeptide (TPR) repeat protein
MKREKVRIRELSTAAWGLLLTLFLGSVSPCAAQGAGDRIREELMRTDDGLARAAEVVSESDSQRARELLKQARIVQDGAWGQFRSRHFTVAGRLTQEARKLGARALTMAREDNTLRNRAERELEKAARALRRARDELGENPNEQAVQLLEEARAQIQRGRQQLGEQNYEVALRLAVSAQRLIRQGAGTGVGGSDRRILRELERTDSLIDRARPIVRESGNEEAMRVLERAISLQDDAWGAYRDGRPRRALNFTREARSQVQRALVLARGPVDADRVAKALLETDRLLERAAEIMREAGDERAEQVLEKATEHQMRAKRLFDDEQYRKALAETRVARRLAMRAIRMVEEGGGR